jgi:phospholipid/cholesterol/gamma-HCH transport system permease protein
MMQTLTKALEKLGALVRIMLINLGAATRTFVTLLAGSGALLRRPRLVTDQIHFIGNYSLVIIAVSGLFVGFVLGLQGYYTLNKYGSEQALGLLVALSLTRELGPVVTALLFAGRAGTSLTAEIGLMKAGEQLAAMEMMAVDPLHRILAPRFWAGVIAMPVLAAIFSAVGIFDTSANFRTRFRITAEDCAKLEANHRATVSRLLTEAHNLDPEGTP